MVAAKMTVRSEDKNTEVVSSMVENTADVKCKSRRDSPNCISENCVIGGVSADMNNTVVSNNIADSACNSATDSGFETNNSQDWNTDFAGVEKCLACLEKNINALFLHGKTGHLCCCYQCAKRIWFETRRCPICRSKVSNIIRVLNR